MRHLLSSVVFLAGNVAVAQGITILASPLITRLYSPEQSGVFSLYISIVGFFGIVGCLRYEVALPLPEDEQSATDLLALCLALCIGIAVVSGGLVCLAGSWFPDKVGSSELRAAFWTLPLSVVGCTGSQLFIFWAVRKGAFPAIARGKLTQSLSTVSSQLFLGAVRFTALGLLMGEMIGRLAGCAYLAQHFWHDGRERMRCVTPLRIRADAIRYWRT